MNTELYSPPSLTHWQGRDDTQDEVAARALRWHQIVQCYDTTHPPSANSLALLGFACDAGVARNFGRVGAAQAPDVLRRVLSQLPAHHLPVLYDAGTVGLTATETPSSATPTDALESLQTLFADTVCHLLTQGLRPIGLGGGHEMAYASFSGLAQWWAKQTTAKSASAPKIGIINLDAHFDLRNAPRPHSGTGFFQIHHDCQKYGWPYHYACLGVSQWANTPALFDRAAQLGVRYRLDTQMHLSDWEAIHRELTTFIHECDGVYLTLCLDVLPAAIAPAVSAPAAYGVELSVIERILSTVALSGKLQLADIAEYNPLLDSDLRTARVAARLIAVLAESWINP